MDREITRWVWLVIGFGRLRAEQVLLFGFCFGQTRKDSM